MIDGQRHNMGKIQFFFKRWLRYTKTVNPLVLILESIVVLHFKVANKIDCV